MKIQKSISTGLLYLTKISSFLALLNPIATKATVIRNPSRSVRSLIALFNNGVTSTTITKSPLENLGNINVQSSINKLNQSSINSNTTTTKTPLKNTLIGLNPRSSSSLSTSSTITKSPFVNFPNVNTQSSINKLTLFDFDYNNPTTTKTPLSRTLGSLSSRSSSSLSINSTTSISSSRETRSNVNVSSIVSRFEAAIKNSNQTTSPQKNKIPSIKKYSTSEVLKLSDEVLNKKGLLDGFNKTNKSLPKLETPLSGNNLDKNLKILQERKEYLNSVLVGSMASKGMIFEKDTTQQTTPKKDPYSNTSPFMRSLLISKGMIPGGNNNQQ